MRTFLPVTVGPPPWVETLYRFGKAAAGAAPAPAYNLAGTLYHGGGDWVLLSVPNALARGVFAAMHEPGAELPPGKDGGPFNAHVTVFRPTEVAQIGGVDKVTERGQQFHYTLGRLLTVEPDGWPDMAAVYMLAVHSPALQELRRAYGLSSLPDEGKKAFHVTVAVKRRGVLGRNDTAKGG